MKYHPDKWLVVKFTNVKNEVSHCRVFATWGGGYTHGESWKLNSGIIAVKLVNDFYEFSGHSGSTYVCHKQDYGTSAWSHGVLCNIIEQMKENGVDSEILDENTDWLNFVYQKKPE